MMQVDYKAFGRRLREYRHARNLTQEKLSELVGVSFQLERLVFGLDDGFLALLLGSLDGIVKGTFSHFST